MYDIKLVLDSISPRGTRLTTFEIQMPKWLVAEFNTHRSIARNSASSRAIPTSKIIQAIMDDPALPINWSEKNTGMTADDLLSEEDTIWCNDKWLEARNRTIEIVNEMMTHGKGVDKQRVNRLLEPWMKTVVVATSTEWEPFFDLRDHPAAQPEFAYIANLMHEAYKDSTPITREWHMPYVLYIDRSYAVMEPIFERDMDSFKDKLPLEETGLTPWILSSLLMSAARCGRVTYYKQGADSNRTIQEDVERGISFATNRHWSPLEHPCMVTNNDEWYGPFYEWKSLRKYFPEENGRGRKR